MKIKKTHFILPVVIFISALVMNACRPLRNFYDAPKAWSGDYPVKASLPVPDPAKKNVFIIADSKLTVLFDMLAPYYLFNATEKANVYIITKERVPIFIRRYLFVMPQLSFREADSMQLRADAIVIPALSIRDEHQDPVLIDWIKNHFLPETKMLSICDGSATAAATGLYDGKPITTHASDFAYVSSHFSKPVWVQHVTVTKSGNLFSTAGVSNAVEGSLTVIEELFGKETMKKVLQDVHYPSAEIKTAHRSIALNGSDKFNVLKKVLFRKNRDIGALLENGINEFDMATILELYGRSFPASFKTYVLNGSTVQTKYGLVLISTGDNRIKGLDELHVVRTEPFSPAEEADLKNTRIIRYPHEGSEYLVNTCLERIGKQYGPRFRNFVKISLDYN
ncbi:MAG TPA: hypothetical protein DCQ97_01150 [Chitinophagaceae bacterium]|nr:hypothetical protein [Chitinophagaceae bacterium]